MSGLAVLGERVWSAHELEAWALPEALSVTEAAERDMVLPPEDHGEPGPYHCDRTAYFRGVQDSVGDAMVQVVDVVTGRQMGKTTALTVVAHYYTAQEPAPVLVVMPTREALCNFFDNRLRRAMEQSPGFSRNLAANANAAKGSTKHFRRNTVYGAWAGSGSAVVSNPIRVLAADEVDEYPPPEAGHASALESAMGCTTNFANRKVLRTSTPTTEWGEIWQGWLDALQHLLYVPCPRCGRYQRLVFSGQREGVERERLGQWYGVTWPKEERDWRKIKAGRLAWYECRHCGGRIENHEKPWMLERSVWLHAVQNPKDAETYEETEAEAFLAAFGEHLRAACGRRDASAVLGGRMGRAVREALDPEHAVAWEASWGVHLGFRLNGLYSPFDGRSWWEFAGEWLRRHGRPERMKAFYQHWLGRPWIEDTRKTEEEELRAHAGSVARYVVPEGHEVLTAGIDVKDTGFHVVVLAWGPPDRVHLVHEFEVDSWELVENEVFLATYRVAGREEALPVSMAALDSGWQADVQYDRAESWADRCRAIKGVGGQQMHGRPWRLSRVDLNPRTGQAYRTGRPLVDLNVDMAKDTLLLRRLRTPLDAPGTMELHAEPSADYLLQLTAEQKQRRTQRGGRVVEEWVVVNNRPNHYLDATVYALAIGEYIGARRGGMGGGTVTLSELQRGRRR